MTTTSIPFKDTPQFSGRDKAYTLGDPRLTPFYKYPVILGSFGAAMADKSTESTPRGLLAKVLEEQYAGLDRSAATDRNIASLVSRATFTVTTAHQPVLFTGPLYFIYKIISTINLAKQVNKAYPEAHIVPVIIIGGEDHDFEEVNHAHLFGRRLTWEAPASGSVGRMDTASLRPVLEELRDLLGESVHAERLRGLLDQSFGVEMNYGRAMQVFVNSLFKEQGLLVLNMDHPELKRHFIPYMRRELLERVSQPLVEETQRELEALGFPAQAHARQINLFYLREGIRERIVFEEGIYQVLQTSLRFTEAELMQELERYPERFSPNVIMRPLYQEAILPNLAYVGGGGELAYWLERKRQFSDFGLNFPMLVRRNSVLWVDANSGKRMQKLEITLSDLMGETEELVRTWVMRHSVEELSLAPQLARLNGIFEEVAARAQSIDPTLATAARAEGVRQAKGLEQLELRLLRAQKQQYETELNQMRALKEKLFPGNGLQERQDNFIPYYLKHGEVFFETLLAGLDPLQTDFVVIQE